MKKIGDYAISSFLWARKNSSVKSNMANFQPYSLNMSEQDFDKILYFYEKFSEYVIFHEIEGRKTKLLYMFKKLTEL